MITVEHSRDVEILDRIFNLPEVQEKTVDLYGRATSLKPIVDSPLAFPIVARIDGNPVGQWVFLNKGNGIFEAHTMMTNEARGILAIEATRKAVSLIFGQMDCDRIISFCPKAIPESKVVARKCGLHLTHTGFYVGQPADYVAIQIDEWAVTYAERFADYLPQFRIVDHEAPPEAGLFLWMAGPMDNGSKAAWVWNRLTAVNNQPKMKTIDPVLPRFEYKDKTFTVSSEGKVVEVTCHSPH